MAPFFMRKNTSLLAALIGLVIVNGYINSPFLWALSLVASLLYAEMRFYETKEIIEAKDKTMGNRLIEGMKALTEVCHNAFDHIKTNKQNIDKANAKLGEHSARLHRLDQQKHRVDSGRAKESRSQETTFTPARTDGEKQVSKETLRRAAGKGKSVSKDVPNAEHRHEQNNGQ
jgi:hypothetical protein